MKQRLTFILFTILSFALVGISCESEDIATGLDQASDYHSFFAGKSVGIITNHTAFDQEGRYISEVFSDMQDVTIKAFFGPEHGIRGSAEAGAKIDSETDPLNDVPIYSLYGKTTKPTSEMLQGIDVLIFDIQDVGARFYTYIYTMSLAMEAAAEHNIHFVVLDRPNPIGGQLVEGNILEPAFKTFVGLYPIPVRHGMTVGELATMFNSEGWLADGKKAQLTVIPLHNWQRSQWYDNTGLSFIKPSPNIPNLTSATVYPGTCLLEGTNVSEGRGTTQPFTIFGAPWIDGKQLAAALNSLPLHGVSFRDTSFTPIAIPGASNNPKHRDRLCQGVTLEVYDRQNFQPYLTGIHIVNSIAGMYPDSLSWRVRHFDRLCGTASVREAILQGKSIETLVKGWEGELNAFGDIRKKYLLYK